jgi:hypothetical protein
VAVLIITTTIAHVIYTLVYKDFIVLKTLFSLHLDLMLVAVILILIGALLEAVGFRFKSLTYGLGLSGFAIYIVLFYVELTIDDKLLVNPISIAVLCAAIPLGVFVGVFFVKQLNLVSRSLTYKQLHTILKESKSIKAKGKENFDVLQSKARGKLSLTEKMNNILNFLKKERPASLFDDLNKTAEYN